MTQGKRPAEIFGYPIGNHSQEARDARTQHWCPFIKDRCSKKSRLIDFPFGVCSVEYNGEIHTICPRRFEEQGTLEGVPKVLEDIALHYFGDLDNTISFSEVRLPNVGSIDFVLVRHKPMQAQVQDFVSIEFQSDSTTSTGGLVQGIRDFFEGHTLQEQTCQFGMNTYDSIKRAIIQLMNKGIVYETWNTKCYWVIQEYIYANLVKRYGFKEGGFTSEHASRFALYDFIPTNDRLTLTSTRLISTTVDEAYQAMRNNPGLPDKDRFVQKLNTKLRARLSVQFD
jgi:hypothetical protein